MTQDDLLERVVPEKVSFYRLNGKKKVNVSTSVIFDMGYAGLDALINSNLGPKKLKSSIQEKLLDEWRDEAQKDEIFAVIPLDDGTKLELKVEYRTNTAGSTIKYPNMVYLQQDGQTVFILRRPMCYDEDVLSIVASNFDFNVSADLHSGVHISGDVPALIPEKIALEVLESYYEGGYTRLTPPYKELVGSDVPCYIREWMKEPVKDTTLNIRTVAEHISTLQAFGLISSHDRQGSHYFMLGTEQGNTMVNIDPDFMLWVPRLYGNEESRDHATEVSDEEKERMEETGVFSREDEGHGALDLGKDAVKYRDEFRHDEEEFLSLFSMAHPSFNKAGWESYKNEYRKIRANALQFSEQLSKEFMERVNEQVR